MKRIILLLTMVLTFGYAASAQSRGRLFYNIGSYNGIGYELPVGNHLVVEGSANVAIDFALGISSDRGFFFDFNGIYPVLQLRPRWYFNTESTSSLYRTGGFVGLSTVASLPMLGLGVPDVDVITSQGATTAARLNAAITVIPHIGWTFNLGKRFYVSPSIGINSYWLNVKRKDTKQVEWISSSAETHRKVSVGAEFGIRF